MLRARRKRARCVSTTTVCSRYEVIEKVGEGAYGEVFKARDIRVDRFVALKFLYRHQLGSDSALWRFQQEARAVSALNHPNIVVLHDFDTDPETGRPFLVLEYLAGGTLRQFIDQQPSPHPLELLRCATSVAAGLSHAHRHHIVHRDVKPSNVLFTEERIAKIGDFGIAKSSAGDSARAATESGGLLGTIAYMSPEQAHGLAVEHSSDIFSFGVLLYETATGRHPFPGATAYDVLRRIVSDRTPLLKEARTDLPEDLDRIIQRATAKAPAERYRDMEELETDLLSMQLRLQSLSEQPTVLARPRVAPLPAAAAAPERQEPVAIAEKRPAWHYGMGLLILAVFTGLGLLAIGTHRGGMKPAASAPHLLAVVPFQCLGGPGETRKGFCEGLANTLATRFTEVESVGDSIRVVPYSEVRNQGVTSASDARRIFKADLALTGSVEFSGDDSIRVMVNLVDAAKPVQMSSRKVDAQVRSLLRLQDEVAEAAGSMLALSSQHPSPGQTRSDAAFDLYLRGIGRLPRAETAEDLSNVDLEEVRRATALLEQAVAVDASYALAHAGLADARWLDYRFTADVAAIDRAQQSGEQALSLVPDLVPARLAMARIWLTRTDPEKAIDTLGRALRAEPKNAEALRLLGNAYADLGRHDPARKQQAIDTFNQAIALRPELWTTYRDLGMAYLRLGDQEKAEQQYVRMLELTRSAEAYWRMGGLFHLLGRDEQALEYLRLSLDIKPTPEAYSNLGTVCYYLKRYDEMIPYFDNALRLSEYMRTRNYLFLGNLGMICLDRKGLEAKGRHALEQAVKIVESRLRASPNNGPMHAGLSYFLVRLGDRREALSHAEEALRLAPDDGQVWFRCALVYERLKQREKALKALRASIEHGHPWNELLNAGDLEALRKDPRFRALPR
jgi:eukaryotic-like serine/threonine-protein kinase